MTYVTARQGWILVHLTEKSAALSGVTSIRNVFSLLLLGCIVLGSLMLLWFSRINYRPLRILQGKADQILQQYADGPSMGRRENPEIFTAHKALDVLSREQDRMTRRIKRQMDVLRDFLLIRLISGEFKTKEEFNLRARDVGINFTLSSFFAAIVQLSDADKYTSVTELLSELLAQEGEGYAFYIENGRVALLLSGEGEGVGIKEISGELEKEGISFQIGVGNIYRNLSELHLSFIEAQTVLGCIEGEKENHVAHFRKVFKMYSGYYTYPECEMREISSAIANRNGVALRESLDKFYAQQQKNYSPILFKAFAYETLNTILKAAQGLDSAGFEMERWSERMIVFNLAPSAEQMWEILGEIAENIIAEYMNPEREDSGDLNRIHSYLAERFDQPDFSIRQTAEHFGMSTSSFTQMFKRRTGQTPISYVNTLKMNRARELLISSDLTIGEIIARIGSYDESGFIRKFKEMTGSTPGEYRKKYRK